MAKIKKSEEKKAEKSAKKSKKKPADKLTEDSAEESENAKPGREEIMFFETLEQKRAIFKAKYFFLLACQLILIFLLVNYNFTDDDMIPKFKEMPENELLVVVRFLCTIILHINLAGELHQSFNLMRYTTNHAYKFERWGFAFSIGMWQMIVLISVELVNMAIMVTEDSIPDTVTNCLAIVMISEFDDYFFNDVRDDVIAELIKDGKISICKDKDGNEIEVELDKITQVEVTSSEAARFKIPGNQRANVIEDASPEGPKYIYLDF